MRLTMMVIMTALLISLETAPSPTLLLYSHPPEDLCLLPDNIRPITIAVTMRRTSKTFSFKDERGECYLHKMFTYCKESECNLKVESGEEMLSSFRVRLYIHNFSFTIYNIHSQITIYIHNYQFQFTFYIVFTNHNFNSILKFIFTIINILVLLISIKTCVHLFDACLKVYAGDAQVVTAPQETRTCPEVWDQMNSWNPV